MITGSVVGWFLLHGMWWFLCPEMFKHANYKHWLLWGLLLGIGAGILGGLVTYIIVHVYPQAPSDGSSRTTVFKNEMRP